VILYASSSCSRPGLRAAILLIAVGIFLAIALAEGILRFFPGLLSVEFQQVLEEDPDNLGVAHPYIGYLAKPNNTLIVASRDYRIGVQTDGYGFRNAWPWPEKAEIVALGDSLTFGWGVEDNQAWPAIVAKALPHFRLINLGQGGFGPQQYLRVYETFGAKLHPKLVLVGFFAGNDFADSDVFDRWLKAGANTNYIVFRNFGKPRSTRLTLDQPIGDLIVSVLWRGHLLASKSRLYSLLVQIRKNLKSGPADTTIFRASNGLRLNLYMTSFARETDVYRPGYLPFDLAVKALQKLQSVAKGNNANVLVILQPTKEEVYLPLISGANLDADPERPLRETLEKLGIPYINLLPDFRARAAKGEVLFFETDDHPNVRGYALIAELVLDYLKNNTKTYNLNDFGGAD
jgi:lysophospholipase L1-like esterase